MAGTRIVLTGGGGMVGRNFLEHPGVAGFEVLAPDSTTLNLRDFAAVQAFLLAHKPDLVLHAAGKVGGIQANMREPVAFLMDNLDMGRNVVWAARQAGVRRLLNLGSSCMYPRDHAGALSEDMVLKGELEPTNEGYALAKVVTARLCEYVTRENETFQYKTLIPCNIYGRHDKFDPARSHLVPAVLHKLHQGLADGAPVTIWGDGSARREFMYAGDLADAMVRAVTHFDTLPPVMNLGLGHDHSVNEYYEVAADVIGFAGGFSHDLGRPVGMARKLVSIERQRAWGWSARHSLREGLTATYQHYLETQT